MAIVKAEQGIRLQTSYDKPDIVWLDVANTEQIRIYGAAEVRPRYRRVPQEVEKILRPELQMLSQNTSGIRARFKTNSPYIALYIRWDLKDFNDRPWRGMRGFDLFSVWNRKYALEAIFQPPREANDEQEYWYDTQGDLRDYVLNFPSYNKVREVYIGIQAGSILECGESYSNALPVVFYGSSITQGARACRPGNSYENFLSRALDMDYVNLGLSGNCLGDPDLVDYMATIPMCCFVCDFDHNTKTAEELDKAHFEVYRRIREKNPTLPFVMISRPDYCQSDAPRRSIVMESYQKALAAGDENVYFLDGAGFFTGEEREACTADGVHPNDLGFYRMSQGMVHIMRRILYGGGLY